MNKIIGLSVALVMGLLLTAFSQIKKPNLKKELPAGEHQLDTLDFKKFRFNPGDSVIILDPDLEKKLGVPGMNDLYLYFNPDSTTAVESYVQDRFRMPVYRPDGNFPMPIHVPDSTLHYTMRIKTIR